MSDSRKRFEEWARGNDFDLLLDAEGEYAWSSTMYLWEAWSARDSEVERLREALKEVAQSLAWVSFGECRGFSENLMTSANALELASSLLSSQDKESA